MSTRLQLFNDIVAISNVQSQPTLIQNSINYALKRVYSSFDYPYYLQDKGVITTVAPYNTGSVDVTLNSPTVTAHAASGATFSSSMVGSKFSIQGQNAFYRIIAVPTASTLTLNVVFQGTSATSQTYNIYQDEYRLAADMDKYKTFRQSQNNISLFQFPVTDFDELHPMPTAFADPVYAMMCGTQLDTYLVGTVTATANTNVITGSGTAWTTVQGLGRMNTITLPTQTTPRNVYTIKSVDSDTQITVYEMISVNVSAGSTYSISLKNVRVQLYQIPSAARTLYYRYFRVPELCVNDWDVPDMPDSYHWVLIHGALTFVMAQKGDAPSMTYNQTAFAEGLKEMQHKLGSLAPDMQYHVKSIDRMQKGRVDGLEAANYDRRWSQP
jgi:hypothetical protein